MKNSRERLRLCEAERPSRGILQTQTIQGVKARKTDTRALLKQLQTGTTRRKRTQNKMQLTGVKIQLADFKEQMQTEKNTHTHTHTRKEKSLQSQNKHQNKHQNKKIDS